MKHEVTRRDFMKTAAVTGAALGSVNIVHAQAKKPMNAVVIGCGGRGSGAGKNFLDACKAVGVEGKIVAVADVFPEKAGKAVKNFGVAENKCFSGFDSYVKAINEPGVNYVIIATPPGFKAAQFKAAIDAGKHVFVEKPVAVDGPSARIMYAAGEVAQQKGLKVAAGTQRRHQAGYLETIKQLHDGAIGDIVALRAYWVNGGPIWHRAKEEAEAKTELEKQIRNWYHYIWLCGDHICEQHVHNIDVCNWIMKDHPVKVWGQGSRQQLGEKSGEIWDNFDCEFEYAAGAHMFSYCGQVKRSWSSVSEAVQGTKGTSNPSGSYALYGQKDSWKSTLQLQSKNPYEQEHIDLINAILNNTELNETKNVTDSTLTAIMGREASYSGALVTWDQILNSEFKYGPDLLYTDASKMTWGAFRTLKPPMPSQHSIFKKPAEVPVA
ncbi:MAG: Gfo/Idh/MocA family oxidoreductase [Verrucomicrobia bacterium]|nr:Gfo/Idh/MocA family oxidoreductase [Verrucomicrobiota bacterium]